MTTRSLLAALAVFSVFFSVGSPAAGEAVSVFAAASLKEAMDEQARRFETETGNKVVVPSHAAGVKIEAGAPADVFISADLDWMDYLEQRTRLVSGSRMNLLHNDLVLIAPAASKTTLRIAPSFDLAAALGGEKLAMANPDSVPAGKYGKAALTALGAWGSVERQTARTENVRSALSLVARGEAALGIVYKSDALAERGVRIVDTFPETTHAPIVYPGALVAPQKRPAARALLEFLRSAAARPIWETYGFTAL